MSTTTDTQEDEDFAALTAILDRIASTEVWRLSDEEKLGRMDGYGVAIDRLHGLRLHTVRTVDEQRVCEDTAGGWSASDRIALTDRTIPRVAKQYVRTAKQLGRYPILQQAAEAGELTLGQADACLHGLKYLPTTASNDQLIYVQSELLESAAGQPPQGMRQLAMKLVAVLFPDTEEDHLGQQLENEERRARRARAFRCRVDGEGAVCFGGKLPIADGEKLLNLLAAYLPGTAGLERLDPLAEAPTMEQRQADAFVAMLDELLARGTAPTSGGDRPSVTLILPYRDLVDGIGGATLTNSGEEVSPKTARRLACDADVIPVVLGKDSEVLDVGRTQRLVTSGIRKALVVRDRGCVFPGCDRAPSGCDAHHVVPWHAGGKTSLANLVLLCRHHHQIIEPNPRAGPGEQWTIRLNANGIPEIRPPTSIDPNRRPRRNSRFDR
ncbi:MAG: DUF222 domain-containing protein [Propionibacteriaceae bacterium]